MGEKKRFLLRLSPALWEELNRWAGQEYRSVNAQIEYLLQRAVDERRRGARRREEARGSAGDAEGQG